MASEQVSSNDALLKDDEVRFELKHHLADTVQGRIYSATDRITNDYCVVKEVWKQLVKMKRSRQGKKVDKNFENEKAILRYLSTDVYLHPGMCVCACFLFWNKVFCVCVE